MKYNLNFLKSIQMSSQYIFIKLLSSHNIISMKSLLEPLLPLLSLHFNSCIFGNWIIGKRLWRRESQLFHQVYLRLMRKGICSTIRIFSIMPEMI